jgi:hypothetical protein
MRYELYLRAESPTVESCRKLPAALRALGELEEREPGHFVLRAEVGELHVSTRPADPGFWEAPAPPFPPVGLDLWIAAGSSRGLAQHFCRQVGDLAARLDLTVYDPQLGRPVDPKGLEAVQESIRRQSDYLTETVGLGAANGGLVDVDSAPVKLSFKVKFYLGLALLLVVLVLAARFC